MIKFNVSAHQKDVIMNDLKVMTKHNGMSTEQNLMQAFKALANIIEDDTSINADNYYIFKGYLDSETQKAETPSVDEIVANLDL